MAGGRLDSSARRSVRQTVLALRVILAGIFLNSGLIKASASAQFAIALAPFALVPETWIRPLSILLPLSEIAAGLLILVSPTKHIGAGLIFLLCVLFAMVLSWALANGIVVSCSCFGQDDQPSAMKMMLALGRDLCLAGLALVVILERTLARRSGVRRLGDAFPL
jgi:Methylamine utilisation protein MauE